MAKVLIIYSTTDGHTRKICLRLNQILEGQDHQCRTRHEGGGQEPGGHQGMMPIGASRQTDIQEGGHRVNAHRPGDGEEHERNVEFPGWRASLVATIQHVARDVEV